MSFLKLLVPISRSSNRKGRRNAQNAPKTRKLQLESLESRQLLAVITVNSLEDSLVLDHTDNDTKLTLREAIDLANNGDVINFSSNLIGDAICLVDTLTINKNITIDGWNLPTGSAPAGMPVGAHKGITIDGAQIPYNTLANAPMVRVVNPVVGENVTPIDVTVRGLTFTNTASVSAMDAAIGEDAADGIAILVANGYEGTTRVNLTVQNCVFTNLKYGARGPIAFYGRYLTIANTLIADNYACVNCNQAAGVHFSGNQLTMNNCTVANNDLYHDSSRGGYGLINYADSGKTVVVHNSIFVDNNSGDFLVASGGKIYVKYSLVEYPASSSIIFDNTTTFTRLDNNYSNLFFDKASGNYTLASGNPAIYNTGNASQTAGQILKAYNNQRGYDLAGNYRRKGVPGAYTVDVGAYTGGITPQVLVTIGEDEDDHTNDFFADGTPNRISLREAYDYIGRSYRGGNFNDLASFVETAPGADYDTIQFAGNVANCVLTKEIISKKDYTINGENLGGGSVTVKGSATNNLINPDAARIFNVQEGTITANNLNLASAAARSTDPNYASTNGKGGAIYIAGGAGYVANGGTFSYNYASTAGGAVFVAQNGAFTGTAIALDHNKSVRGGGIANLGTASVLGASQFTNNTAGDASTNGFGGAAYNAGTLTFGAENDSTRTTFSSNSATCKTPVNLGDHLIGGSGGAIYNTAETVNVYHADFTSNEAAKYGGAISNFGVLTVQDSNFTGNIAKAGGAVQTSGTATITGSEFTQNLANLSLAKDVEGAIIGFYRLTANDKDYGGNGGAIFASGPEKSLTIKGNTTFTENNAKNAGGAIDFISGALTFDGANVTFNKNHADVIGGAIVAAEPITFSNAPTFTFGVGVDANTADVYAPTVAVTCNVADAAISTMRNTFFPDEPAPGPGRDKLDTFIRYGSMLAGTELTFAALAQTIDPKPTNIYVSIDKQTPYSLWDERSSHVFHWIGVEGDGNRHTVDYYADGVDNVVYRMNITLVDSATSVICSQIDLSDRAFLYNSPSGQIPAGVSLRVYSASSTPVSQWIIDWGDGSVDEPVDHFGFTCNAYHSYAAAGRYAISLKTVAAPGAASVDRGVVGYCSVSAPASAATLQEELFADNELLDELFIEFQARTRLLQPTDNRGARLQA